MLDIKWAIVLGALLGIVAAILYLHISAYKYTAQLIVTPVESQPNGLPGNLSGLAAMAGISLPQGDSAGGFNRYLAGLQSRIVAARLADDAGLMRKVFVSQTDPETGQWRKPRPGDRYALGAVKQFLGFPDVAWAPPGAADLQVFLQRQIEIISDRRTGITTISFNHPDPVFAGRFLQQLHDTTDDILRQQAIHRADSSIAYLQSKLRTVDLAEHRVALAGMLSEQEKARMIASSDAPHAAEPFGPVAVSARPTSPTPQIALPVGLLGGALVGLLLGIGWRLGANVRKQLRQWSVHQRGLVDRPVMEDASS